MKRIFFPLLFVVIILLLASSCEKTCQHEFSGATCTSASICQKCGEINGEALGHKWTDATCTKAKTCSVCGVKDGKAHGHTGGVATCTLDGVCSVCGVTYIEHTGHKYDQKNATNEYFCATATCSKAATYYYSCICGEKSSSTFEFGDALEHTPGDWQYYKVDYVTALAWKKITCSSCNSQIDTDFDAISLHDNNAFLFSPNEFCKRLGSIFNIINKTYGQNFSAKITNSVSDTVSVGITNNGDVTAIIMFTDQKNLLLPSAIDKNSCISVMMMQQYGSTSDFVYALIGVVLTCDPTLEISDAIDVNKRILASSKGYTYNGISYAVAEINNKLKFVASLLKK